MNRTRTASALATLAALGLAAALPASAQQTLYVSNVGNNTIERFTPGGVASVFASNTLQPGSLSGPAGLALDGAGNLYAANSGNNTIERFTPGGVASVFASTGLSNPSFLAFGPAPAPEPSQWASLGVGVLGLAGLGLRARRRKADAA